MITHEYFALFGIIKFNSYFEHLTDFTSIICVGEVFLINIPIMVFDRCFMISSS